MATNKRLRELRPGEWVVFGHPDFDADCGRDVLVGAREDWADAHCLVNWRWHLWQLIEVVPSPDDRMGRVDVRVRHYNGQEGVIRQVRGGLDEWVVSLDDDPSLYVDNMTMLEAAFEAHPDELLFAVSIPAWSSHPRDVCRVSYCNDNVAFVACRFDSVSVVHRCPACSQTIREGDVDRRGDGCIRCRTCEIDGRWYHHTAVRSVVVDGESRVVLRSDPLLWRCGHCSEWFYGEDGRNSFNYVNPYNETESRLLCGSCVTLYGECGDCGEYYAGGSASHRCAFTRVNGYGHRPPLIFHGDGPLFLGLELECESKNAYKQDGVDLVGRNSDRGRTLFMKSDGSLDDGFEMVSHPMTCDWAMEHFPWHVLDGLREMGFRSWNTSTCGMHIHMSRDAFTDESHLLRFMLLAYRGSDKLVRLSGRRSDRWASWSSASDDTSLDRKSKGEKGFDRYQAINVQNDHTIEMRFWRGSLNPTQVKAALQWCHAAWEYTRDLTTASFDESLSWVGFVAWVDARADRFPELLSRIAERTDTVVHAALKAAAAVSGPADYDETVAGVDSLPYDDDDDDDDEHDTPSECCLHEEDPEVEVYWDDETQDWAERDVPGSFYCCTCEEYHD